MLPSRASAIARRRRALLKPVERTAVFVAGERRCRLPPAGPRARSTGIRGRADRRLSAAAFSPGLPVSPGSASSTWPVSASMASSPRCRGGTAARAGTPRSTSCCAAWRPIIAPVEAPFGPRLAQHAGSEAAQTAALQAGLAGCRARTSDGLFVPMGFEILAQQPIRGALRDGHWPTAMPSLATTSRKPPRRWVAAPCAT